MADEKDQTPLELFKIRLDFLKHISTLSGLATVIILTLIQRAPSGHLARGFAVIAVIFALTAFISVFGIGLLLIRAETTGVDGLQRSSGAYAATLASTAFSAAITVTIGVVIHVPIVPAMVVTGIVGAALLLYALFLTFQARKRRTDEQRDPQDE